MTINQPCLLITSKLSINPMQFITAWHRIKQREKRRDTLHEIATCLTFSLIIGEIIIIYILLSV